LPFIFVVMLLPLLSMGSCTNDDVIDSQTTDSDATTGGCLNNSDCESGFSCQNSVCVSDDRTLATDVDAGSTRTLDAVDASPLTDDTVEGDDDDATDADEGPGIPDTADESGAADAVEAHDDAATDTDEGSAIPDAVDESEATDAAQADAGEATDATDESDATDAVEGDNDAESGNGSVDEGDLASCKKNCADDDLACTGVCGGSPLCLSECAVAYTECNDACDAAFGG
jgi:hypothetical protein